MQASVGESVGDRLASEAKFQQLRARDHAVLLFSQRPQS
jgi:hypothetical protein